jgi:hypothetical protein
MNSDDCQLERILGALAIGGKVQLHMVSAQGFFSALGGTGQCAASADQRRGLYRAGLGIIGRILNSKILNSRLLQ